MGGLIDLLKEIPLSAVLKEKIADVEAKYAASDTENAILKDDLHQANMLIAELKQQVKELTHIEDLNETELKLLNHVANVDYTRAVPSFLRINFFPDLTLARVEYHLERLNQLSYVRSGFVDHLGIHFAVTQSGRKLLLEKNLL